MTTGNLRQKVVLILPREGKWEDEDVKENVAYHRSQVV